MNAQITMEEEIKVLNQRREEVINRKYSGQHLKLMALFRSRPGEWIALPEVLSLFISQYGRVVKELREAGEQIENKSEWVNGQRHTAFRWTP
jgi:hypothetical protein